MRVDSNNKLAILQCQYTELFEQTQMLCGQLSGIQQQITNLQPYVNSNNGDRSALTNYHNLMSKLNRTNSQIQQNNMKLATLQRRIAEEENRIAVKIGKNQMQQARNLERQQLSMARSIQRQQATMQRQAMRQMTRNVRS